MFSEQSIFPTHWIDFAASPVAVIAKHPFVVSAVSPIVQPDAPASSAIVVTVEPTSTVAAAFAPRRINPSILKAFPSCASLPFLLAIIVQKKENPEELESII